MTKIIKGKKGTLFYQLMSNPGQSHELKKHVKSNVLLQEPNRGAILNLADQSWYKDQQKQIHGSNQKLLYKLQDAKSSYNVEKWELDRLKSIRLIGMRSKYNYQFLDKKDLAGLSINHSSAMNSPRLRHKSSLAGGSSKWSARNRSSILDMNKIKLSRSNMARNSAQVQNLQELI